ncbi:hypothetical protein TNCV_4060761 [Trichonephila clavipes]|nr:hypothetical protein TNCV_4060761 [Trichonephila clavipes]
MTHVQNTEEESVVINRHIRGYSSTNNINRCGRQNLDRCVIRYEEKHETNVSTIDELLQTTYGEEALSHPKVGRWCCMLNEGRQSVQNEDRSERTSKPTNESNVVRRQDIVLGNLEIYDVLGY